MAAALAYSGMLFYDHTNALTQFQGYNNATHEYRINNIARVAPGGAFNGSINFMLGGTSRFFVGPTGNIGIGTAAPLSSLEIRNAFSTNPPVTIITSSTFSDTSLGNTLVGRKARGTAAAPTAVLNNDALFDLGANGYGATGFGGFNAAGISMRASENWTDTAHGTQMQFSTTSNGASTPSLRMTINSLGNVGIGTSSAASLFEVNNGFSTLPFAQVTATTFVNSGQGSLFVGRKARGTAAAPLAVQNGDVLAGLLGRGYGATNFNGTGSGSMLVRAAETWTDTAQGTSLAFNTTSVGTAAPLTRMTLTYDGNLGIGTGAPQGALEVVQTGNDTAVVATAYANGTGAAPFYVTWAARGTQAAPAAVQTGDLLGAFGGGGYGTTTFHDIQAAFAPLAAENFSDTARGASLVFGTTRSGPST